MANSSNQKFVKPSYTASMEVFIMFKKKNEKQNNDLFFMLLPLMAMLFIPSNPQTIINVYSDKGVEVKNV